MLPVVAIVGRPNVGKSTLFNRLTRTRDAIMSDYPGTTRDRQYGECHLNEYHFIVIDTGGIIEKKEDAISELITTQAEAAINDANFVLFVIDARAGIMPEDKAIAHMLRRTGKPIVVVANKADGLDPIIAQQEGFELGLGEPQAISASHGMGVQELLSKLFPEPFVPEENDAHSNRIKLAIVGRPNVGKSTLTNRMLGEERVIVHDSPGTTRDSIYIPLDRMDKQYTLIDTAGVRKRKKVHETPEKFSVVKSLQSIEDANVVLYVIDANLGVSDQDLKLLGFIVECGRALVIAVNKWDGLTKEVRDHAKATIDRQLDFVNFARVHFISALHGSGVGNLFESIDEAYDSAIRKLSTSTVTRLLQKAVETHQPPIVKGRRVKLRYAHAGGNNPPRIIIHGTQLDALPESYRKFLSAFFQKKLKLYGTPVRIEYKVSENPYG